LLRTAPQFYSATIHPRGKSFLTPGVPYSQPPASHHVAGSAGRNSAVANPIKNAHPIAVHIVSESVPAMPFRLPMKGRPRFAAARSFMSLSLHDFIS
jgi:hypothetical protein